MFVGFNDYRLFSVDDSRLTYTVDTNIHHVEGWGSLLDNYKDNVRQAREDIDTQELRKSDYYKEAASYGKNCQKVYVDWKWVSISYLSLYHALILAINLSSSFPPERNIRWLFLPLVLTT